MPPIPVWMVLAGLAATGGYYGGKAVYTHVVKPVDHAVCHVVTLGHKCKPVKKPVPPAQNMAVHE